MFVRVALLGLVAAACAAPAMAHETKGGVPVTDAAGHVHIHVPGPAAAAQTGVNSPDEESYDTHTMTGSIARPSLLPDEHTGALPGENDLLPVPGPATVALPEEIPAEIPTEKPAATVKPIKKQATVQATASTTDASPDPVKKKKKLAANPKPAAQPAKLAAKSDKRSKVKAAKEPVPAVSESLY